MADADWLRLQKVVFARYVQQKLRGSDNPEWRQREVKDVVEEMKDGVLLVDLMEVMSGIKMEKKIKAEKMRIKLMNAVTEALKFVGKCGVDLRLIRIQAEDIVDGNEKVVLAMVFQIIIKYLKFDEDGDQESVDVREGLCLWLNNKIDGYDKVSKVTLKSKKIPTKVFHNGLIFNALVHKMRPKLVDYAALSEEDGPGNLQQALELGERYLNIEQYVTPADITKMDELSIIVYLSDWFTGVILLQKQDVAARRVGKLVDLTILHDKLRAEYTEQGKLVSTWVDDKIAQLSKREFDDTLGGVKKLLEDFYAYKGDEKGVWIGKKLDSTGLFNNLQTRLANHKRPVWVPPAGTSPSDLDKKFDELAETEIKRSIDLNTELARQVRLHRVYKRFQANSAKLAAWAQDKSAYVNARETVTSVDEGEDCLEELLIHSKEQGHVSGSQLSDLSKLCEELVAERFEFKDDASAAVAACTESFDKLQSSSAEKKSYLEGELQKQKDLNESLCKAFADAASAFESWIKEKRDRLAGGEGDLDAQVAACKSDLSDTADADAKLAEITAKDAAVQERAIGLNPHTNLTSGDLKAQWAQFQLLLNKKIALLDEQIEEAKRGGLTPEQAEEIDANFSYFDKDNNGFLGKKELRVCLQSLGEESRPQDIAALLEKYDTDKSGTIKKAEFVEFMKANLGDSGTEPEMVKAFQYLCYDKEFIQENELTNVVNDKSFKDHHVAYLQNECKGLEGGYDYKTWTSEAFAR